MPTPIVKTVYLCAWFGIDFSIFLLCQVKKAGEIHNYKTCLSIWKNNCKPQNQFNISPCRPEIILHLTPFWVPSSIRSSTILILRNKLDHESTVILYEGKTISEHTKIVLFYLIKLFLNMMLYYFESMSNIIVVIKWSNKPSLLKWHFCNALFHSNYATIYNLKN